MSSIVKIGKSLANTFSKIIPLAVYLGGISEKALTIDQTEPTST